MTVSSQPIIITTNELPIAFKGHSYKAKIEIQTPLVGQPTFSIDSGVLPSGISLNATNGELTSSSVLADDGQFPILFRVAIGNNAVTKSL